MIRNRLIIFILFLIVYSNIFSINKAENKNPEGFRNLRGFGILKYQNRDSATDTTYYIISKIDIQGNKTTKRQIITRELCFKENDTIKRKDLDLLIKKSRDNLLNTTLFNFATIEKSTISSNYIVININLTERWYTWPVPILQLTYNNFSMWLRKPEIERLDYGAYIIQNDFRGRKETLKLLIKYGYDRIIYLIISGTIYK